MLKIGPKYCVPTPSTGSPLEMRTSKGTERNAPWHQPSQQQYKHDPTLATNSDKAPISSQWGLNSILLTVWEVKEPWEFSQKTRSGLLGRSKEGWGVLRTVVSPSDDSNDEWKEELEQRQFLVCIFGGLHTNSIFWRWSPQRWSELFSGKYISRIII